MSSSAADGRAGGKAVSNDFLSKLRQDGVIRPQGLAFAGFGAVFLAAIPLTSWIAQPNSLLEKTVNGVCSSIAYVGSAGASGRVSNGGKIAALSTLYIAMTYALSGAGSAAGVEAGTEEGRDNNHPRKQVQKLEGLPLRLHSAHYNLMEMFPGFALSAALTQAIAPADQTLINLLGLHVLSKVFLYYPSYLLNIGVTRSIGHVLATASVINVALRLSKKA
ncbi:hypothetical protein KC353_g9583 [Hortaea werneckii]|uniref:MAPEG family protein n=1 Tax=Hortaea werneckii TaxID=91943 RepID=A0A3M7DFX7_HORWE|nr:hypothetical protein KC353_g9583 [Hortaea werneckii]RMY63132.1 hypothetical protein D0865_00063 [Hortaea werneckii]